MCVGIDPVVERLPERLRPGGTEPGPVADALRSFSLHVLDAVSGRAACVKLQSACFERYGPRGVEVRDDLVAAAKQRNLEVILDAKRGDVSISAEHYAAAVFGGGDGGVCDWVTVNSYLGPDAIEPFLRPGAGVFALVRTSNPGSDAVQALGLADGRTVAEAVAGMVADLGRACMGRDGYSAVGAVVGATKAADIATLRALMPQQILLVPGFGAQGGSARDVRACFAPGGTGAIVSSSRSVIYAFEPGAARWTVAVADAARRFADEVADAIA